MYPLISITMPLLILFLLLIAEAAKYDYCSRNCENQQHALCGFPPKGDPDCTDYQFGLSLQERESVLELINGKRQLLANGNHGILPKAADMNELSWDQELETIAQRWADQCQNRHKGKVYDKCAVNIDGISLGQNVQGIHIQLGERNMLLNVSVQTWWDQVKEFPTSKYVGSYLSDLEDYKKLHPKVRHYAQMVWSRSTKIGCGVRERVTGEYEFYLVCNFMPAGVIKEQPLYQVGEPCSSCTDGRSCSSNWPGLCH